MERNAQPRPSFPGTLDLNRQPERPLRGGAVDRRGPLRPGAIASPGLFFPKIIVNVFKHFLNIV